METINLYVPHRWTDVHLLRRALTELGRKTKITRFWENDNSESLSRVNWGGRHGRGSALNAEIVGNKYEELKRLADAGVLVPEFTTKRPRAPEVAGLEIGQWMPRTIQHRAAIDLLEGLPTGHRPAYYVRRVDSIREFRVHVFRPDPSADHFLSIRAGVKVPAPGTTQHPWIRTLGAGWMFDYGDACQQHITRAVRNIAKAAVKALYYDFGAVDIGILNDECNTPIVFEVNSAPGLANGNTAAAYARHIAARIP